MRAAAPNQSPSDPFDPTAVLVNLILTFLAPMFLTVTGGNITHARLAAAQTLESYCARADCDLIIIAQIVAFGLAALGSLSLSMTDGLSLPMILRLRGSAQGSSRAAEQNRRALREKHPIVAPSDPIKPAPNVNESEVIAAVAAVTRRAAEVRAAMAQPAQASQPSTTPRTEDQRTEALWADAFTDVANEIAAELPNLPPAERKIAAIRAAALSSSAQELLSGSVPPRLRPGDRGLV